jgi:hypothetical protein
MIDDKNTSRIPESLKAKKEWFKFKYPILREKL